MVWGSFAVLTQICTFSLIYQYLDMNCISFDSKRRMLHHDINHVNMSNEIRVCTNREFKNCNFSHIFLN